MDPRDQLLADTQRIFAEYVVPLTLEEARNARHILRLLIEWKSRAEGQTLSPASTARMQFGISPSQLLGERSTLAAHLVLHFAFLHRVGIPQYLPLSRQGMHFKARYSPYTFPCRR